MVFDWFGYANSHIPDDKHYNECREKERSMLNELLFTLFLTQVGTVAVITACIVGVMTLFYVEITALDKCDAKKLLED